MKRLALVACFFFACSTAQGPSPAVFSGDELKALPQGADVSCGPWGKAEHSTYDSSGKIKNRTSCEPADRQWPDFLGVGGIAALIWALADLL